MQAVSSVFLAGNSIRLFVVRNVTSSGWLLLTFTKQNVALTRLFGCQSNLSAKFVGLACKIAVLLFSQKRCAIYNSYGNNDGV